jgi:hypothetical protein
LALLFSVFIFSVVQIFFFSGKRSSKKKRTMSNRSIQREPLLQSGSYANYNSSPAASIHNYEDARVFRPHNSSASLDDQLLYQRQTRRVYAALAFLLVALVFQMFSFWGLTSLLAVWATHSPLSLSESGSTGFSSAFLFLNYVAALVGGVLADNYFGHRKTVLLGSIVGSVAFVGIFFLGAAGPGDTLSMDIPRMVSLPLAAVSFFGVAVGVGSLVPCMSSFPAVQLNAHPEKLLDPEKHKKRVGSFFSWMYFGTPGWNVVCCAATVLTLVSFVFCFVFVDCPTNSGAGWRNRRALSGAATRRERRLRHCLPLMLSQLPLCDAGLQSRLETVRAATHRLAEPRVRVAPRHVERATVSMPAAPGLRPDAEW